MTLLRFPLVSAFSLSLIACGGQTSGVGPDGGGPPATNSTSLIGTWDIQGSFTADPTRNSSGILTLANDEMLIVFGDATISYRAKGDVLTLTHTKFGRTNSVNTTRIAQAFDTGILPIAIGGAWTFADGTTPQCTAQVGTTTTMKCDRAASLAPLPSLNASTSAIRVKTLTSVFGDLGGEWNVTTEKGAACTLRFEGAAVSIDCKGPNPKYNGTASIVFGEGVASGSTSTGIEFAAKRR